MTTTQLRFPVTLALLGACLLASSPACHSTDGTGGGTSATSGMGGADGMTTSSSSGETGGAGGTVTSSSSGGTGGMGPGCTNVFQGSFTIQNTIDIAMISPYCEITGDLTIKAAGVTSISLPLLQKVDGALHAPMIPDLVSVSLPALTSASRVSFLGQHGVLSTVQLPKLTAVATILEILGGPLGAVDVTAFQSGNVTITGDNGANANISLPNMASGSEIIIHTSGSVSVPKLAHPSLININGSTIDLGGLSTVDNLLVYSPTAGVSLPLLTAVSQTAWIWTAGVASAPGLVSVGQSLHLQGPSGVNLSNLQTVGPPSPPLTYAFALEGSSLTTLDLPSLASLKGVMVLGKSDCTLPNTGLTQINLPSLTVVGAPTLKADGANCSFDTQCCSGYCKGVTCSGEFPDPFFVFLANPVLPQCRVDALVAKFKCGTTAKVVQACGGLATGPCP